MMLVVAGWLPSWALACWQVKHRRWRSLLLRDLLGAGVLVLLAITPYLPPDDGRDPRGRSSRREQNADRQQEERLSEQGS
jgi:hypothetical protein